MRGGCCSPPAARHSPASERAPQAFPPAERAIYAAVGEPTRAPIGWIEFCVEYKPRMRHQAVGAARRRADAKAWSDLVKVNDWVNDTIKPITDLEHWGVVERWNYPDDGYGDCEDYVLLKRRMLMQAGWPREALLITVVRDKKGDGHAVLTVKTDRGEFILDNQERRNPGLEQDRLPLRQAAVAVRSEHLGRARRAAHGAGHRSSR